MNSFDPKEYWEKRLKNSFGLHGVGYLGLGHGYNNWMYKVRRHVFTRVIQKLNFKLRIQNVKVIDIGSGTGFYIEIWRELGVKDVTGCDITQVSVEKLQTKFSSYQFVQLDIGNEMVFVPEQGSYDIVTAFDMLYHIVDDRRYKVAIKNINNLLKPGAYFIFSENFLHRDTERVTHQASRSLKEITEAVIEAGFVIVDRVPMFFLMNDPIDTNNNLCRFAWNAIAALIARIEVLGYILGAILYPIELFLTRLLRESPTTEVMICKKTVPSNLPLKHSL